jgi:hypothetical protein
MGQATIYRALPDESKKEGIGRPTLSVDKVTHVESKPIGSVLSQL